MHILQQLLPDGFPGNDIEKLWLHGPATRDHGLTAIGPTTPRRCHQWPALPPTVSEMFKGSRTRHLKMDEGILITPGKQINDKQGCGMPIFGPLHSFLTPWGLRPWLTPHQIPRRTIISSQSWRIYATQA